MNSRILVDTIEEVFLVNCGTMLQSRKLGRELGGNLEDNFKNILDEVLCYQQKTEVTNAT